MNIPSLWRYGMASPAPLFKARSDPTRRALFERLCRVGALPVHALTTGAGISQAAVSKHLVQLRGAGLVLAEPLGRVMAGPNFLTVLPPY